MPEQRYALELLLNKKGLETFQDLFRFGEEQNGF